LDNLRTKAKTAELALEKQQGVMAYIAQISKNPADVLSQEVNRVMENKDKDKYEDKENYQML
tara:strand:+ start:516 stop:701 length:186 start_codon:yes stop_codon:yes gene_type:complete